MEIIYRQLEDLRSERIRIIENRGLQAKDEYERDLETLYLRERELKSELITITLQIR